MIFGVLYVIFDFIELYLLGRFFEKKNDNKRKFRVLWS